MGPDWKFGVNGTELVEGEEEKLVGMFSASDLTKEVGRLEVSSPAYIPPTQPRTQLHLAQCTAAPPYWADLRGRG